MHPFEKVNLHWFLVLVKKQQFSVLYCKKNGGGNNFLFNWNTEHNTCLSEISSWSSLMSQIRSCRWVISVPVNLASVWRVPTLKFWIPNVCKIGYDSIPNPMPTKSVCSLVVLQVLQIWGLASRCTWSVCISKIFVCLQEDSKLILNFWNWPLHLGIFKFLFYFNSNRLEMELVILMDGKEMMGRLTSFGL